MDGLLDGFEGLSIVLGVDGILFIVLAIIIVVIRGIKTIGFTLELVLNLVVLITGSHNFAVSIVWLIIATLDHFDVHFIWIVFNRYRLSFAFCISEITILLLFTSS